MYSFGELFGTYLSAETLNAFSEVTINECALNSEARNLKLKLYSTNYIPCAKINILREEIKHALQLESDAVEVCFDSGALCVAAIEDIVLEIRTKNIIFNGFFNEAQYTLDGNNLKISLKYGGHSKIQEGNFETIFKTAVKKHFGLDVNISFDGVLEDAPIVLPEPEVVVHNTAEKAKSAPKEEAPKEEKKYDYKPKDGLPVYLESAKLFYGRKIDTNVKKLTSVILPQNDGESVYVCAWGEVFGCESKVLDTKRGGKMVKVKFYFSDTTNSFSASLTKFFDPKYTKNMDEAATDFLNEVAPLKDGACVIVNGDYSYDSWSRDFVLDVKALATIKKYEEIDDFDGEKRVELHCHTNMSAKDAVASAGDIVNRAYKWGHKAVAITDHGVVQAYPAVAEAVGKIRKGGGEFKAIYGVENYFIDDTRYDISNLTNKEIAKLRNHQILLVKDLVGLKNLYQLISEAHLHNFYGRPIILRSQLDAHREGLIVGSACEQGELYRAIIDGKDEKTLLEIADYYDYLEIQPLGNNEFMVRDSVRPDKVDKKGNVTPNRFKHVTSIDVVKDFNRKVVELADKLGKMVVATGDVHFLKKEDGIIRQIVMAGQGFDDIDNQAPLHFKSTTEMMEDFSYFGDRAYEFVVENPNKIAQMVSDEVIPVPKGNYPPVIEGSDDLLREICWRNAKAMYGDPVPEIVEKRLNKELNSIINNGFSIMYISAQKLVAKSEELGYYVG